MMAAGVEDHGTASAAQEQVDLKKNNNIETTTLGLGEGNMTSPSSICLR